MATLAISKNAKKAVPRKKARAGLANKKTPILLKELKARSRKLNKEIKRGTATIWKPGLLVK